MMTNIIIFSQIQISCANNNIELFINKYKKTLTNKNINIKHKATLQRNVWSGSCTYYNTRYWIEMQDTIPYNIDKYVNTLAWDVLFWRDGTTVVKQYTYSLTRQDNKLSVFLPH